MAEHSTRQRAAARLTRAKPAPLPTIGDQPFDAVHGPEPAEGHLAIGVEKPCDSRCERFATCRPDAPGWILKKQAAANVGSTPAAMRQRAARVGYVSPARHAMPRCDQPRLCLDAAYFALQARMRKRPPRRG